MPKYQVTVAPGKEAEFEKSWQGMSARTFFAEVSYQEPEDREAIIRLAFAANMGSPDEVLDTSLFVHERISE